MSRRPNTETCASRGRRGQKSQAAAAGRLLATLWYGRPLLASLRRIRRRALRRRPPRGPCRPLRPRLALPRHRRSAATRRDEAPLPWRLCSWCLLIMDFPALNSRPGRVVEAEVFRHYGTSVSAHLSPRAKPFFLVLSVGRCRFRLTLNLVELLLHATHGSSPRAFDVVQLSDTVFRFSVSS